TLIENSTGLDSSAIITITYMEEPPVAVNDSSLNNLFGTTVYLTIVADDSLSDGTLINSLGDITVDIDLSMPGIQNALNVPGQGDWTYNPATGDVSFEPEVGFNGNPDAITYQLIENQTGLSDTAEIVITYLPEDCILICVPVQVMKVN
ncbi:Ig-like domain-containing protein, partial [Jiulongibacter sediminis]